MLISCQIKRILESGCAFVAAVVLFYQRLKQRKKKKKLKEVVSSEAFVKAELSGEGTSEASTEVYEMAAGEFMKAPDTSKQVEAAGS
jgi:hypothetical protein